MKATLMDGVLPAHPVIAVFGLGYVGCVTAAGLASLGLRVIGVDHDAKKVALVQAGEAPFYEDGLGSMLRAETRSGRLTATENAHDALQHADVAMVCVGTPCTPCGRLDPVQITAVSAEIAVAIERREKPLIIAIRSTVLPGTCEAIIQPHFDAGLPVSFVSNPEFLREGQAVADFLHPTLIVSGSEEPEAARGIAMLYRSLRIAPVLTRLRVAEMIKYACNALNAVKIDFANEIGTYCASAGIDADQVMETVCREQRQNRSAYLMPGFAFGGSCLGKDLRALLSEAREREIELPLLEAVLPSNQQQLDRATKRILAGRTSRLGVFGLAFKAGTDDVRESAAVYLIERLAAAGRDLRVFDPCVNVGKIYGSNLEWLRTTIPSIERISVSNVRELLDWSEEIVLVHRPTVEVLEEILASGISVTALYRGDFGAKSLGARSSIVV